MNENDGKPLSPRGRLFMALAFFYFGGFLFSFVFGWIPSSPSPTRRQPRNDLPASRLVTGVETRAQ